MVQNEYSSVGTAMSSKLDGYMRVQKMLVNVHCSPSPQHQYCWMHCHEFQDSRWQTLVACTTCNLLQSSRQAKVFSRGAKDSCSSYLDAHSEGDKIVCTAISQYAFLFFNCMCSGRNSGFEGRGACMSIIQLWLEVCWIRNSWSEIPFKMIWFLGTRTDEKLAMQKFPICSPFQGNEAFGVRFDLKLSSPGCPADVVTFVWPNPDSVLQTRFLHLKSCFLMFYFLDKSVEAKNVGAGTTDVSLLLVEDGIFESLVSLASALFTKSKYYSCVLDFKLWCLSDVVPLNEGWRFIIYTYMFILLYSSWLFLDRSLGHFIHPFHF